MFWPAFQFIEVIKQLMRKGVMANINQVVDYDTAAIVASALGFEAQKQDQQAVEAVEPGGILQMSPQVPLISLKMLPLG